MQGLVKFIGVLEGFIERGFEKYVNPGKFLNMLIYGQIMLFFIEKGIIKRIIT